jgi:Zn-finger nucleic acid-binding protein
MALSHHETPDEAENGGRIDCPKCRHKMETVDAAGVKIDRCKGCGGIWLDALELEKVLAAKGAAKKADPRKPVIEATIGQKGATTCPRDRSMLIRMADKKQPHVKYESCKVCGGVFLDAGELRDLGELTVGEWIRTVVG